MILARPTWLVRQRGGARARVPTPCHLQLHKRKAVITDHKRDNSEDEKMKPGDKSLQHRMNFPIPASTRPLLCVPVSTVVAKMSGAGGDWGGPPGSYARYDSHTTSSRSTAQDRLDARTVRTSPLCILAHFVLFCRAQI